MGHLTMWAPWRVEYVTGDKEPGCPFCRSVNGEDDLMLARSRSIVVTMNRYPYNNGHLLVAPTRHVGEIGLLSEKEMGRLLRGVEKAREALAAAMNPDGFNIGLNLGTAAGAGVGEHLHFHVVPRWAGDVNAMAVFADIRVIPEHIRQTHLRLQPIFDRLELETS